jgi:hypothetical protein
VATRQPARGSPPRRTGRRPAPFARTELRTSDAAAVKQIIDRYPDGSAVQVFYDPKDPTIAYLETRRSGGAVFLLLFGGLFAVMGLGALVLVALVA